jgi:hypothetical protein
MSSSSSSSSSSTKLLEVSYQESATELFLAIEEMEWMDAFDIIESDPNQVQTWVRSTGTQNITFLWSVWRRLPIHEVRTNISFCFVLI